MDAMHRGTPSITTSIGAESMSGELPWGGTVENNAGEFVAAAVAHYQNEALWQQKQQQGFTVLRDYFYREDYAHALQMRLSQLDDNIQRERNSNFIGQMLRHHHHKSTQYMGQWIEAKNQR